MKKQLILLFVISVFFATSLLALTVKVGVYSNPPLSFYKNGQVMGVFPDVLNYIAKKEGWTVDYVHAPFFTLLEDLKSARVDMICAVAYTDARARTYDFSHEYLLSNWGQVYVPYESDVNTPFDLNGKRVGVLKSDVFYMGKLGVKYFLDHLGVHAEFVEFNTYTEIFKALEERKINAAVLNRIFGETNKYKYDLKETPIIFSPIEEKFAFSKQSIVAKKIAPVIDEYVKKMKMNPQSVLYTSIDKYLEHNPAKFVVPIWVFYIIYMAIAAFLVLLANLFILKKLFKRRTEELRKKNKELQNTNEEINAMNEELENAYATLEAANSRFQSVSTLLSQLDMVNVIGEEFFNQVLDKALQLIPQAKYGSVSVFEYGEWKFVASRGHNLKILKSLSLKPEYAYFSNRSCVVDDILKGENASLPSEVLEKFKKATKPIKGTLIAPMKFSDEIIGYITLDIPKESEESFSNEDMKMVGSFAKIASAFYVARKYLKAHEELQNRIIFVMVKSLEKYDVYTKGHSERVANCSMNLAKRLGLNEERQKRIYQAALLHDIGKLFVPKSILNKDGRLTHEEYDEMKKHPSIGAELIEEGANLKEIALIVHHHHERWDGNGYPDGLKGEKIPLESRIMVVCDTFDAMTSDRPYRKALSKKSALEEIERNAGKQFDPSIVQEFLEMAKTM